MDRKNLSIGAVLLIIGCFIGGSVGYNIQPSGIKITSIKNGDEVHSIVPIDAVFDKGDEVGVWVNDSKISSIMPYYWNNMLEPAGDYEVKVGVLKDTKWTYDTVIITIPKEFIVPKDYNFTEDFVVHVGQTVIFKNGVWDISTPVYSNGLTPISEREMLSLNNFGTLIVDNAVITCKYATCEGNSVLDIKTGKIFTTERYYIEELSGNFHAVRFDDTSSAYLPNILTSSGNIVYCYYIDYSEDILDSTGFHFTESSVIL